MEAAVATQAAVQAVAQVAVAASTARLPPTGRVPVLAARAEARLQHTTHVPCGL